MSYVLSLSNGVTHELNDNWEYSTYKPFGEQSEWQPLTKDVAMNLACDEDKYLRFRSDKEALCVFSNYIVSVKVTS